MAKKKKTQLIISNKLKFRKPSKSLSNAPITHLTFKQTLPTLGEYAIQAASSGLVTRNQLESARVVIKRRVKGNDGHVWVLLRPRQIVTKRALETRMGRGKGAPVKQVSLVSKGQILFEFEGVPYYRACMIFKKMHEKLPVKVNLIQINNPVDLTKE